MRITSKQYDELFDEYLYGNNNDFHKKLEEITGIEAKPYTEYQYFYGDNFIGDSEDHTLADLLENAHITIGDEDE